MHRKVLSSKKFKKIIWDFYHDHRRDFPWRQTRDPYKILVSEIMLQQTQAPRVVPKYESFLKKFPNTRSLAAASNADVLREWQGLGYNRRGLYLKRATEAIEQNLGGKFPKDFKTLCSLPGIGPATAGDLLAFAWNEPVVVIETNIRTVFIHFFFADQVRGVTDKEILPLIEKTLDRENPREWYWALFDYGAFLKKTAPNPSRKSAHHAKQSRFEGSFRQKRGAVLRELLENPHTKHTAATLMKKFSYSADEISKIVSNLERDGLIVAKSRGILEIS